MKEGILFQIFLICVMQLSVIIYFNKITNSNPLSDVGFIYFFLIFSYILFPGIGIFLAATGDEFFKIALGNPSLEELYKHQWRQIVFYVLSFFGFFIIRNKNIVKEKGGGYNKLKNTNTIVKIILTTIIFFIFTMQSGGK